MQNPVRKIKLNRIKINLIIKGNNNYQARKLPRVITPNIIRPINPGIIINRSLKDLTTLQGYKNQNTIN